MNNSASKTRCVGVGMVGGFTLIELLVVIAIISILAAIIFPVFSTAEENARQNSTIAHMHDVSAALALYKLDNQTYPPILFAYACDAASSAADVVKNTKTLPDNTTVPGSGCNIADTMATIGSDANATTELVGLYPEYVKDWHEFVGTDDSVNDANGALTISMGPNYLTSSGGLTPADGTTTYPMRSYFEEDSFDVNPRAGTTQNNVYDENSAASYIIRYQTSWTPFDTTYDAANQDASPFWADYQRQLRWTNPPADTYVTGVTDHIPNSNKLIVLFAGGNAEKIEYEPVTTAGSVTTDEKAWDDLASSVATTSNAGCAAGAAPTCASAANFWKFRNGQ